MIFIPLMLLAVFFTAPFQEAGGAVCVIDADTAKVNPWVDSLMAAMTPDERVGQLIMLELTGKTKPGDAILNKLETDIDSCHIGGVIMFYGGLARQVALVNRIQARSKVPLMIAQDGEWGLSMRLDSVPTFPRNLALGAISDDGIIYELGAEISRECRRVGVNMDFMPSVDIYDNPANTVIANRSFGSDPLNVARKGCAMMLGMRQNGVFTTAKHFPGHGNTDVDSHEALPVINNTKARLDTFELVPYRHLINNGAPGVMVGHLFVPSLEKNSNKVPSSISKNVIDGLLKTELGFKGLVFTDALAMKGVSGSYEGGEVAVRAFEAGVDMLLMPPDGVKAYKALLSARNSGRISQAEIDRRCRKILMAKFEMGLNDYQPIKIENIYEDLNTEYAAALERKIFENAVTLISNKNNLLPLRAMDDKKIAVVSIGKDANSTEFEAVMGQYVDSLTVMTIAKTSNEAAFNSIAAKLADYDVVVIAFHGGHAYPTSFGTTPAMTKFVDNLATTKTVVFDVFNSPLCLTKFNNLDKIAAIVVSYEDGKTAREVSARMIMGSLPFLGRLPVGINNNYKEGTGINTNKITLE
ncbi:MAG: glycoside hydrolase family 3 C-terminal domain-containing protein [Bacteroidales bacterium]|nr:glycoside hydrolase family 3 C-terminal domain-containing protein [Bacteroidales bacterium]